jgi:hypothetical protein
MIVVASPSQATGWRSLLRVLDEFPSDGFVLIWRHHVVLRDWRCRRRSSHDLPHATLGATLASLRSRSDWCFGFDHII